VDLLYDGMWMSGSKQSAAASCCCLFTASGSCNCDSGEGQTCSADRLMYMQSQDASSYLPPSEIQLACQLAQISFLNAGYR